MATGQDQRLTCVNCGEEFLFTAGEQEFYRERGLTHAPTRCKRCRELRKSQRSEPRGTAAGNAPARPGTSSAGSGAKELYAATCSNCGRATEVPFRPVEGRPIFCRDCYRDRKREGGPRPGRAEGQAERSAPSGDRQQGAIKWFNKAKGFGFIHDDGGEDIFVHFSALAGDGAKNLTPGDRVEFDVVPGARGKQAANVTRLD